MKKFFTLAVMFVAAITASAQEKWTVYNVDAEGNALLGDDGKATLKADFVANEVASEASVVNFSTANVEGKFVSGPFSGYKTDKENTPFTDIIPEYNNSWQSIANKGVSADNMVWYVQGRGNPVVMEKVVAKPWMSDDVQIGYQADLTNAYYQPDGSNGLPTNGSYFTLTTKVAGKMAVTLYMHKGHRTMFVAKASDAKALTLGTELKVSGYMDGNKDADGNMIYFENIRTKAERLQAYNDTATVKQEIVTYDYYMPCELLNDQGLPNTDKWGILTLTWDAAAGETYYVFNHNTQVGLSSYEFTPAGGGSSDPALPYVFSEVAENTYGVTMTQDDMLKNFDASWVEAAWNLGVTFPDAGTVLFDNSKITIKTAVEATPVYCNPNDIFKTDNPELTGYVNLGTSHGQTIAGTEVIEEVTTLKSKNQGLITVTAKVSGTLKFTVYNTTNKSCIGIYKILTEDELDAEVNGWVSYYNFRHGGPDDEHSTDKTLAKGAPASVEGSVEAGREYIIFGGPNRNFQLSKIVLTPGAAGIEGAIVDNAQKTVVGYYTINGVQNNGLVKGLNIVKYSDGSTVKVMK